MKFDCMHVYNLSCENDQRNCNLFVCIGCFSYVNLTTLVVFLVNRSKGLSSL